MHAPTWLTVALAVAATFRLTRLLTADRITQPLRDWAYRRDDRRSRGRPDRTPDDEPRGLAYLVTCPWCVSIYTGSAVAGAAVAWPTNRLMLWALLALAASAVTGIVSQLLPD